MRTRQVVLGFAVLLLALIATSRPQRVGDGHEYVAMALNLAALHGPALSHRDIVRIEPELARHQFAGQPLTTHTELRDARGRQDFFHFWFYPALAAPGIWVTRLCGVHPNYAFVALNLLLFLAALRIVAARLQWWLALALFCSPSLWWIDKAHTEIFTFSLLAIAFALLAEAPWWSMVALGAAATQNPPIALLLACAAAITFAVRSGAWRDRRTWAGVCGGILLALLHPGYYEWRWGLLTPQIIKGTAARIPTIQEMGAVLWDPNLGILYHAPLLAVIVAGALVAVAVRARSRARDADLLLAFAALAIFLPTFAQSTNMNNGATPGMSRYGLWLVPLAVPLLRRAGEVLEGRTRTVLIAVALASCGWSVFAFHPRRSERYCAPTWAAQFMWTRWPGLDNPLPEIFAERLSSAEPGLAPVAAPGCTKVLLIDAAWPVPCRPRPVPARCTAPGALCYANLESNGVYSFVAVPRPADYSFETRYTWVWTEENAAVVERILTRVPHWQTLRLVPRGADGAILRDARQVAWTYGLESGDEMVVFLRQARDGATVTLQPTRPMDGVFIDAESGADLQSTHLEPGRERLIVLPVPTGRAVALALR